MVEILVLLAFGRMQEHFYQENSHAWHWALAYAACGFLWSLVNSGEFFANLISSAIAGLYAWVYFVLLRRVADNLMIWLLVWIIGALLPIFIVFQLISAIKVV
ncbi:MAG: hypothetical protein Q4A84_00265 [Neisseria sp.]|uniref:hypothetical protein n=1 Tax=Neisseria sp. TaxID=192066 RepID=UPI0026DB9A61|nr:hypothetical protein [Neisseria sp.]MDO4640129.1 hypothetical protein [Neisseria sp.]